MTAALTIPYIVPLFLGMTYNAKTQSPGVSIFDDATIKAHATNRPTSEEEYMYAVVNNNSAIRDALDISAELAIKVKLGDLNIKGSASYLKNDEDLSKSVVILFKCKQKTRILSLNSAPPRRGFTSEFHPTVLGTHYVHEIVYGVEMLATLKFTETNFTKARDIKAQIEGEFSLGKKKQVSINVSGKLDTIEKKLANKTRMEISYFGTMPLKSINNTIAGVKNLIENFNTHVRNADMAGKGVPMEVNLKPLTDLPEARQHTELEYAVQGASKSSLEKFQDGYLRLSEARDKLFSWSRSLPFDLSDASSKRVGRLLQTLNRDMNLAYKILAEVDLSKDTQNFDRGQHIIDTEYMVDVKKLIKEIDEEVSRTAQVSTDTYIHFGNDNCPGIEVDRLYYGSTVGSTKDGIGGMAKYDCMPIDMQQKQRLNPHAGYESIINSITYGKTNYVDEDSTPFKGPNAQYASERVIPCAKCYQKDASTVSVFPATTRCPASFDLKYTGFLMSGAVADAHTTDYICVDDTPPDYVKRLQPQPFNMQNQIALTLVHTEGALPKTYHKDHAVPCAVCVLKGGRLL